MATTRVTVLRAGVDGDVLANSRPIGVLPGVLARRWGHAASPLPLAAGFVELSSTATLSTARIAINSEMLEDLPTRWLFLRRTAEPADSLADSFAAVSKKQVCGRSPHFAIAALYASASQLLCVWFRVAAAGVEAHAC